MPAHRRRARMTTDADVAVGGCCACLDDDAAPIRRKPGGSCSGAHRPRSYTALWAFRQNRQLPVWRGSRKEVINLSLWQRTDDTGLDSNSSVLEYAARLTPRLPRSEETREEESPRHGAGGDQELLTNLDTQHCDLLVARHPSNAAPGTILRS